MFYTASDIIKRAKDLSDTGNTDFISFDEAMRYINDAYSNLYQLCINRGDDFFVKRFQAGHTTTLPKDFYQLRSVKQNGFLFPRLALDAAKNEVGYTLINNQLIINGATNTVEVTYYPKPTWLTMNQEERKYGALPKDAIVKGAYNTTIAYWSGLQGLIFYDYINDVTSLYEMEEEPENVYIDADKTYIYKDNNITILDDGEAADGYVEANYVIRSSLTGMLSYGDSFKGHYLNDLELTPDRYIIASPEAFYYTNDGNLYKQFYNDTESILIAKDIESFNVIKDYLIYQKEGQVFGLFNEPIPIDFDFNELLGYTENGIIYTKGSRIYWRGNLPETLLNFPNNTYFSWLAYKIATYIVAKQGGDVTILSAQLNQAQIDLEDNSRDAFGYVRIKNVY